MTIVHHLHPLSKMLAAAVLTALALALNDAVALLVVAGFVVVLLLAARVRLPLRAVAGVGLVLALVAGVNYLATGNPRSAGHYSLRVAVLMLCGPVLALTTAPQDTVRALTRAGLPAGLTVPLMLVWRFVPVLAREAAAVREADRLRGPRSGGWGRAVLVPYTSVAIEYADQVALALELRGFDPAAPRTVYKPPRATWRDAAFLLLAAGVGVTAASVQWGRG